MRPGILARPRRRRFECCGFRRPRTRVRPTTTNDTAAAGGHLRAQGDVAVPRPTRGIRVFLCLGAHELARFTSRFTTRFPDTLVSLSLAQIKDPLRAHPTPIIDSSWTASFVFFRHFAALAATPASTDPLQSLYVIFYYRAPYLASSTHSSSLLFLLPFFFIYHFSSSSSSSSSSVFYSSFLLYLIFHSPSYPLLQSFVPS
jgi:hypothetical protein